MIYTQKKGIESDDAKDLNSAEFYYQVTLPGFFLRKSPSGG